jgi:hypothetical protein
LAQRHFCGHQAGEGVVEAIIELVGMEEDQFGDR